MSFEQQSDIVNEQRHPEWTSFIIIGFTSFAIGIKFILSKRTGNGKESTNLVINKSATRGTATVLFLSVTFIILTGPISIKNDIAQKPVDEVTAIFLILHYLNHAINAILYCLVGSRFRTELMKTIKCCKTKDNSTQGNRITLAFSIY